MSRTSHQITNTVINNLFKNTFPKGKVSWVKDIPKSEGLYWISYRNGKDKIITLCSVMILKGTGTTVTTTNDDFFVQGPKHGGPGPHRFINHKWGLDKSVKFGPKYDETTS